MQSRVSDLFDSVLVRDSRINDITSKLTYGVQRGPSSDTYQQFPAVAITSTNQTFNVQVPSQSTVINREVLWDSTVHFTVNITNVATGQRVFKYGSQEGFQPFPLNSLITTMSADINNTKVSHEIQNTLPALLRLNDTKHLKKYNGMSPILPDMYYQKYSDANQNVNNPLGGIGDAGHDNDYIPRGAHPITAVLQRYNAGAWVNVETDGATPLTLESLSEGLAVVYRVEIVASFTEPLFLSPFIFGDPDYNRQGFVGINALSLNINTDVSCKRFWAVGAPDTEVYTVSLGTQAQPNGFTNSRLLMNFLTTQDTDLISPENVVPFHDFKPYLSFSNGMPVITNGSTGTVVSQNIQINQIPDYFIVMVRKPLANMTVRDSSYFLPIKSVSINFSNTSGLLSSATPQDLYRISVENGSTQNWYEFNGEAMNGVNSVNTMGSLLVLNPAKNLSLPSTLSCGSIGQFTFQITMQVKNTTGANLSPEICIICVNSGIFSTLAGNSTIYTGVLTREIVVGTQPNEQGEAVSSGRFDRLIGGVLSNKVATALKQNPLVKEVRRELKGSARSGGAMSGGAVSGGAMSGGRRLDKYLM